jgi:hypothetical protein
VIPDDRPLRPIREWCRSARLLRLLRRVGGGRQRRTLESQYASARPVVTREGGFDPAKKGREAARTTFANVRLLVRHIYPPRARTARASGRASRKGESRAGCAPSGTKSTRNARSTLSPSPPRRRAWPYAHDRSAGPPAGGAARTSRRMLLRCSRKWNSIYGELSSSRWTPASPMRATLFFELRAFPRPSQPKFVRSSRPSQTSTAG